MKHAKKKVVSPPPISLSPLSVSTPVSMQHLQAWQNKMTKTQYRKRVAVLIRIDEGAEIRVNFDGNTVNELLDLLMNEKPNGWRGPLADTVGPFRVELCCETNLQVGLFENIDKLWNLSGRNVFGRGTDEKFSTSDFRDILCPFKVIKTRKPKNIISTLPRLVSVPVVLKRNRLRGRRYIRLHIFTGEAATTLPSYASVARLFSRIKSD